MPIYSVSPTPQNKRSKMSDKACFSYSVIECSV